MANGTTPKKSIAFPLFIFCCIVFLFAASYLYVLPVFENWRAAKAEEERDAAARKEEVKQAAAIQAEMDAKAQTKLDELNRATLPAWKADVLGLKQTACYQTKLHVMTASFHKEIVDQGVSSNIESAAAELRKARAIQRLSATVAATRRGDDLECDLPEGPADAYTALNMAIIAIEAAGAEPDDAETNGVELHKLLARAAQRTLDLLEPAIERGDEEAFESAKEILNTFTDKELKISSARREKLSIPPPPPTEPPAKPEEKQTAPQAKPQEFSPTPRPPLAAPPKKSVAAIEPPILSYINVVTPSSVANNISGCSFIWQRFGVGVSLFANTNSR